MSFHNKNNQLLALIFSITFATISLIASLLTLYLIKRLNKSNGYMSLVISLTKCQIVYDFGFYFFLCYNKSYGIKLFNFFNTWGGLSTTLWSNIIILVTCHIIVNLRSYDIEKKYYYFIISVFIPSIIIASLAAIFVDNPTVLLTYFILRTISIFVNVVAILVIFYKIYRLYRKDPTFQPNSNPVYILSMRLVYYCLVQTITRIGSSWYQLQYGFGSASEYDASSASTLKTVIYLSEFVLTPSAGIGYLIVFLRIQPDAWRELKKMLTCYQDKSSNRIVKGTLIMSEHDNSTVSPLMEDHDSISERSSKYYMLSTTDNDPHNSLRLAIQNENEQEQEQENDVRKSSSTRESLFPLLEMDEADLAREIDRIYVNQPYLPRW